VRQREEFDEFYQANYRRLVAILLAVLGDRPEAEDAVQEAFARAYVRWPTVSGYDLPETWVRRVALRLAIDSGRGLRRRLGATAKLRAARQPAGTEPSDALPFTPLGRALMRLPMREREVLVLHYVADLSVDQISADRGLPAGTVKDRLAAGRRRLERELAECQDGVSHGR
jgi:RNA polymerase sigma-70 factor (ECF subfamily)